MVVAVALSMAGLLTLRFLVADDGYPAILSLRADMEAVHAQLGRIHGENRALEGRIVALQEESYAVEKLAREELDFAQPGELIYLIPEDLQADHDGSSHAPESGR